MQVDKSKAAIVLYTNYKGEKSLRIIIPLDVPPRFGTSEWHKEPQWLLRVYDCEKKAEREFAMSGFSSWCKYEVPETCLCPGGYNSDSDEEFPAHYEEKNGQLICTKCKGTRGGKPLILGQQ